MSDTPPWLARMQAAELATGTVASFGPFTLTGSEIRYEDDRQPLAGVHARVEAAGEITERVTATRVLGGAIIAGPVGAIVGSNVKKRRDERELYLHVEGPRFAWVALLDPNRGGAARQFAAQINTAAREQ